MTNTLKQYFPMIQEREQVLETIQNDLRLRDIFNSWKEEQQEEFLGFCTGVRGIKMLYDPFFKEILNPEYTPERLDDFLSVVLQRKVRIVRIMPNDSTRVADETSLLITDIIVELEDGSLANVEIQKIGYTFPGERCACYSADMLMRQYKRVRSRYRESFSYMQIKNVYLIVIYENSPKAFKELPTEYYHYGRQVFHTGLELNMLQEFVMIPLDIFHKIKDNDIIDSKLDAWLTFLSDDRPDRIIELIKAFPEFKPMYENLYQMCQNVERVMEMFSEELRIMDRNTVKYMIEEQQQEIESQQQEIESQQQEIESQQQEIESQQRVIENNKQEIESQQQKIRCLGEKLEAANEELKQKRRMVIENMLRADMPVEDIAKLVECDITYAEKIKRELQL